MRSRPRSLMLTLIIGLLGWATVAPQAQVTSFQTVSPFDIVGFIEAATVMPATDGFSGGGTITVNGTVITVPTNTLLQMPAFALTWQELFKQAPAPYGPGQSGLAMTDTPTPLNTYEVHIQGNRVANQYIAGLMFISQQSLNIGAGFINFIDYSKGEMRVGGLIGNAATGARVRINDPAGKFGPASHVDDRFTIDEDNPTVRSETGYPMCLPRVDPTTGADDPMCPQMNRPKSDGQYLTIFTMDALPSNYPIAPPRATNPLLMAPFEVGDYINYNGILVTDSAGGTYVDSWSVIANIGLFTAPGTQPVYTVIDVMILGTGGAPNPLLPQEAAIRTRMEGFSTDPTSFVDLFATDVDACTGKQTLRYYDTLAVDPGPPTGRVTGRWRWRPNQQEPFLPPSRMLTAINESGMYFAPNGVPGTPNGLLAGFYTAPNFAFIFAENLGIGNPPVPSNFIDFPFLANGSGPYPAPGAGALGTLGQLSPWPGAVVPTKPTCVGPGGTAAFYPIADAGANRTVGRFTSVTLDGGNSRDTTQPALPLSFSWVQTGGVHVKLNGALTATPTFTTPNAATPPQTPLQFTLTVSNGILSSSASVTVAVTSSSPTTDTVTITSAIFTNNRSQLLVAASATDAAVVLTLEGFGVMGAPPFVAPGIPAPLTNREWRQVGVNPPPVTVTVRSSLGGIATLAVTFR
jgi:hypothetical protein